MEERNVQSGGQEGASQGEPTSQTPGTEAPSYVSRDEVERLLEEQRRHDQSVRDRQIAELRRDFQRQQQSVEEDDYDPLLAQAGYFQQPPQQFYDPATGQYFQDPYASQKAEAARRATRAKARADREMQNRLEAIEARQQTDTYITRRLRSTGIRGEELSEADWATMESFDAAIGRITSQKAEVALRKKMEAEMKQRLDELDQQRKELLREQIRTGKIGDILDTGPAATSPAGDVGERLAALNDEMRMGRMTAETFRKRRAEIESEA